MNSTSPDAPRPPYTYTAGLKGYRPQWDLAPRERDKGGEDMAIHTEQSWKRHSNLGACGLASSAILGPTSQFGTALGSKVR